jgi:lysine biosynthesis protein LysW
MTTIALCPECNQRLKLGARPHIGQRSVCFRCNTHLEVVGLSPPELDIYDIYLPRPAAIEKKKGAVETFCIECDHSLKLGTHPRRGEQFICPECQTHLEVVSLNPLELDIPSVIAKGVKR